MPLALPGCCHGSRRGVWRGCDGPAGVRRGSGTQAPGTLGGIWTPHRTNGSNSSASTVPMAPVVTPQASQIEAGSAYGHGGSARPPHGCRNRVSPCRRSWRSGAGPHPCGILAVTMHGLTPIERCARHRSSCPQASVRALSRPGHRLAPFAPSRLARSEVFVLRQYGAGQGGGREPGGGTQGCESVS